MTVPLAEPLDVLARTPETLKKLLGGTPPGVYSLNEGPDTWSPIDVVGHLVRADETSWLPRARRILETGESLPFDPPDGAAPVARFAGWTIDAVLDAFSATRAASLDTVRAWDLTDQDLRRRGHHPDLGIVTLGQLFATWAVHDFTHLAQIARVMAKRYGDDVGIWRTFLPILDR
jgi:DinB superfamily